MEYVDISNTFDLGSAEWDALQAFSDILQVHHTKGSGGISTCDQKASPCCMDGDE